MEIFKPGSVHIDFVGRMKRYMIFSLVLVLLSIGVVIYRQVSGTMNWGIDFAGGTLITVTRCARWSTRWATPSR
jgi:preprotein translocase subunit SecF